MIQSFEKLNSTVKEATPGQFAATFSQKQKKVIEL